MYWIFALIILTIYAVILIALHKSILEFFVDEVDMDEGAALIVYLVLLIIGGAVIGLIWPVSLSLMIGAIIGLYIMK